MAYVNGYVRVYKFARVDECVSEGLHIGGRE